MSNQGMHTPGPWVVQYTGVHGYCLVADGKHIATSLLYRKDGGETNAFLMAAAPDMLDALAKILAITESAICKALGPQDGPTAAKATVVANELARAALTKAGFARAKTGGE